MLFLPNFKRALCVIPRLGGHGRRPGRYFALAALAVLFSSCGTTTRALVRNNAERTETRISITTTNTPTTSVEVSPDVEVNDTP